MLKIFFFSSLFLYIALVPARYILAILGSIGMAIVYGLKVNLSVAMVAMLNNTAIKSMSGNKFVIETANATINPDDACAAAATEDKVEVIKFNQFN